MKTFHLTVAKVGETLFEGEVVSVLLPGKEGLFQVLSGHEAFVSELVSGTIVFKTEEDKEESLVIDKKGVAEVSHHQVTVLL